MSKQKSKQDGMRCVSELTRNKIKFKVSCIKSSTLSRKLAPATRELISSTLSSTIPSFSLNKSANLKAPPPVAFRKIVGQTLSISDIPKSQDNSSLMRD